MNASSPFPDHDFPASQEFDKCAQGRSTWSERDWLAACQVMALYISTGQVESAVETLRSFAQRTLPPAELFRASPVTDLEPLLDINILQRLETAGFEEVGQLIETPFDNLVAMVVGLTDYERVRLRRAIEFAKERVRDV